MKERKRPSERILAAARMNGADLTAMTTLGRSGVSRALVGSVTEGVLRHSGIAEVAVRGAIRKASRVASKPV